MITPFYREETEAKRNYKAVKWCFKSQLTTMRPWAGHLTPPSLSLLVSKERPHVVDMKIK